MSFKRAQRVLPNIKLIMELSCKPDESALEYLKQEVERIIISKKDLHFMMVRLDTLLTKIRIHFGPHPQNVLFQRFLRIALKHQNFVIATKLLEKYLQMKMLEPKYSSNAVLYMLNCLKEGDHKHLDINAFSTVLSVLLKTADCNAVNVNFNTSLLAFVIRGMDSDFSSKTEVGRCFEHSFNELIKCPFLDVDLQYNKDKVTPLQLAINEGKYKAAMVLLKRFANVKNIIISDIVFIQNTAKLFRYLYFAGYRFPPAEQIHQLVRVDASDDVSLADFSNWLQNRQQKKLPLICIAWNVIRSEIGTEAESYLPQLCSHYSLPDEFKKFAQLESFFIAESN